MATVPTIQPRVGLPSVPSPFVAISGRLADSTLKLAGYFKRQEREDELRETRTLDTEYSFAQQVFLYGEDGQGGYNSKFGKAAIDDFPAFLSGLDALRQTTLDKARASGADITMLENSFNRRDESIRSAAFSKVSSAKLEYDKQLSQAQIQLAYNSVGTNPNAVTDADEKITAEVLYLAGKYEGLDDSSTIVQARIMEARGPLIDNAISQALNTGDVGRAARLLDRSAGNGDLAISPKARGAILEKYQAKILDIESDQRVEFALQTFGEDEKKAYKWIQETTKGDVREETEEKYIEQLRNDGLITDRTRSKYKHARLLEANAKADLSKGLAIGFQAKILSGELKSWKDLTTQHADELEQMDFTEQNQLYSFFTKMQEGGIKVPTDTGRQIFNNVMIDGELRKSITSSDLYNLKDDLPTPMINKIVNAVREDQNTSRTNGRRRLDRKVTNTLKANGLDGEEWNGARAELINDFYDKLADRNLEIDDKNATDALIEEVFNPQRLNSTIQKYRESGNASTTATQRLNAIYKARKIEDDVARGNLDIMFREILDKSYKGTPSASQLDQAERTLLDKTFTIDGWFFSSEKNLLEVYTDMEKDEINKSREALISQGAGDPSRAQIALFFAQQGG